MMAENQPNSENGSVLFDEVDLSLEGMKHLLNNDWDKSQELFSKYKYGVAYLNIISLESDIYFIKYRHKQ